MTRSRRCGLTLVELLVVIAIVGVLTGLLLSAVQAVRAAAAGGTCANNLRQIAMALHAYHDSKGRLPIGIRYSTDDPQPYLGWHGPILPYLEQNNLWQAMLAKSNPYDPNFAPRVTPVKLYACPADGIASGGVERNPRGHTDTYTSYLGVAGVSHALQDFGLESPPAGVLFEWSRVRLSDITDGLSNTLMVGERPVSASFAVRSGRWYHAVNFRSAVLGVREERLSDQNPETGQWCPDPIIYRYGTTTPLCDDHHFWSYHRGGANFAFADGSVRFIPYTAVDLLPALATRAAGDAAVLPD